MADYSVDNIILNGGGPFQSNTNVNVETLPPIQSTVNLATPAPLKSTVTLEPTESKITTDSKISTDSKIFSDVRLTFTDRIDTSVEFKPIQGDLCVNLNLGRLPPTQVRQPYQHRLGFTLFGVEIFGLEMCGQLDTTIEDAPRHPKLVGEARTGSAPVKDGGDAVSSTGSGLRIRLGR